MRIHEVINAAWNELSGEEMDRAEAWVLKATSVDTDINEYIAHTIEVNDPDNMVIAMPGLTPEELLFVIYSYDVWDVVAIKRGGAR